MNNPTSTSTLHKSYCLLISALFLSTITLFAQNESSNCNDTQPPVLDCSNLRNSTVCNIRQESLGIPTATDDQTPSDQISITFEDDETNVAPCYASGTILRTWTATDLCGNTSICVQEINISDLGLVSGCRLGGNQVIKCELGENLREQVIRWDEGNKNFLAGCANNSCRNLVTVTSSFDPSLIPEECVSITESRVFYTITDECGRTASKIGSYTVLKTTDPICDNIEVLGENNQLIINNLTAPNTHVKVLNKDYGTIYECIGDCGESVVVPDLNSGEFYRTNIQVYDGNWQLICDDFQEVRMEGGSEPCDTICQGELILRTQADVDAFCGCENFRGTIVIGLLDSNEPYDITNIDGLKGLKRAVSILIQNTLLENLEGLEELENIVNLYIRNNRNLLTLEGLEKVDTILGNFELSRNSTLKNTDGLSNLEEVGNSSIFENTSLLNLNAFRRIKVIGNLIISANEELESLEGLNSLDSIISNGQPLVDGTLVIENNSKLKDISAIRDLQFVGGNLIVIRNSLLQACCRISNLLDDSSNNGIVKNVIIIENNLVGCNSVEEILQNCQNSMSACESIEINTDDNRILLTNLTAPNNIIKVFDKEYNIVYECVSNCVEKQQLVSPFPNGTYIVDLQLYDENWANICSEQRTIILENTTDPCNASPCETIPPVLANIPADVTYSSFGEIPAISSLNVTATDNCDESVFIEPFEVKLLDPLSNVITRTFTATDNCGNTTSATQTITIATSVNTCEDISLESFDNQLAINIFNAPNTLVKVFDDNWQLVFQCGNDCDETLILENLQIGDIYRLDAQFYDENWQLICSKKADKRIGSDTKPCPDPICQGNITFANQAEVDAFCGCELIDGVLTIGDSGSINDITDLGSLAGLKEVVGGVNFLKTQLKDLSGLNQLEKVGGLTFFDNLDLSSFAGLESLTTVESSISVNNAPILSDISSLHGLKFVRSISFTNASIKDLSGFQNIENATINRLSIFRCNRLISLNGLEGIKTIRFNERSGSIVISENEFLTDISALSNVEMINGSLTIRDNRRLVECCPIAHLIDDDLTSGVVQNNIIINNNRFSCGSVPQVLEECQELVEDKCAIIQIDRQPNQVTFTGIDVPNPIVKVFDKDYQSIFECVGDCEESITLENINPEEIYYLDIQFYDQNWNSLCNFTETITPNSEDRTNNLKSIDFSISPNPAQSEVLVDLNRLEGEPVTLKLQNQFGQVILEKAIAKATRFPERIDLSQLNNGLYFLQIQAQGRRAIGKKLLVNRLY